ncbi:MAG: nucleotide sugar dehydrogenase [Deltaproteobacteria bacterium]|nr:nucleotide sugar dehydrogenase [Deltaproteobacteria bacterium]
MLSRIASHEAVVGIVGVGYVGLPRLLSFAEAGFRAVGFDIDPAKVDALNAGESYISYLPAERVKNARAAGMEATTDFARVGECDALLLCVPTPLDHHQAPDLSFIVATAEAVAPHLAEGVLVVLESTTYPGTTREMLLPILEAGSGRRLGDELRVAYSPEREDPHNKDYSDKNIPKLAGGLNDESRDAVLALYGAVVSQVVPCADCDTAEAAKLLENIFRAVNIALVNELKVVFDKMGIDVWRVIEAARTKPFGFMPFYPGPGLGGHCIPIDPFYLTWKAREVGVDTRFIELAGQVNHVMPEYVVGRLIEALNDAAKPLRGSRVLLLGVAYKKNVEDLRESASLRLMRLMEEKGAAVDFHDPHVPSIMMTREYPEFAGRQSVPLDDVEGYDAVLVATAHDTVDHAAVARRAKLIVDTRNVVPAGDNVYRA